MLKLTTLCALVALTSSPSFARDTVGAGWGADGVRALTPLTALAGYDSLTNGNRVVFDGSQAWIEQDDGTVVAFLGSTPAPGFASFVEVDPGETFAVLGESVSGVIYRVPLTGGGLVPLATLNFNFAFAYETGAATGIVSAATCGFGCGNELYRLDLTTGATALVANVSGPSGPLAFSSAGDLYYAVQSDAFPTPVDSIAIVRWTSSQITAGPFPLTQAQASVFTSNLDGAASLAFDPDFGHLYVAEAAYLSVSRVIEIDRAGAVVGIVADAVDAAGNVEIFDAPGAGALAAFQPAGARVQYRTTDFNNATAQIVRVTPRRPQLTSVQNLGGTMTFSISGATPNTACFVIVSPVPFYNPIESAFDLGTYRLWTGMPYPNTIRRLGNQITTDAHGNGSFTAPNPAPIQGTRVVQALVRDANGVFRGASTAVTN